MAPPRPPASSRRVRRAAATAIALAGFLDVVSAITPPLRDRLHVLLGVVPLAVPQAAAAAVALAGVALLAVARSIRRGQRHAWAIACGLLTSSVLLHLLKGVDVEEAVVAAAVLGYLVVHRDAFAAPSDRPSVWRAVVGVVAGTVVATATATIVIELDHGARVGWTDAVVASSGRLLGISAVNLPDRLDDFLTPVLLALGIGLVVTGTWLAGRPALGGHRDRDLARARRIVAAHGRGSLDYFALRDDKEHWFAGHTLVAYAVVGGVCLVSPDPIGPPSEREAAWTAFRRFADRRGWPVAVVGARESWLDTYRAGGMRSLYVGDEAVVDCRTFDLAGRARKGLRQAVHRIARNGYRVTFHDPSRLDPEFQEALLTLACESRQGAVERGFSMTLGRLFDPRDVGLLLAVASDSEGRPVAFCQYVPAPELDGWSLDVMRRSLGDHPNGLLDFVVVSTIEHVRERGQTGLGLNFATLRAVMAGEAGFRLERWVLQQLSTSMQIESLWRYNAKFGPDWVPRYAAYDAPESVLPAAMAVARAESFWELPVIGRFLARRGGESRPSASRR